MIGHTLSHYRIIEKIGAGGMGVVYRAKDEHLDRDVAIKVLPKGTLADENVRTYISTQFFSRRRVNRTRR
jgi:serine/threonine protein kinase